VLCICACDARLSSTAELPLLSKLIVERVPEDILFEAIRANKQRVNERDWRDATPLLYAVGIHLNDPMREANAEKSRDVDTRAARISAALLDAGANPNAASKRSSATALLLATNHGFYKTVKILLEARADPNFEISGQTPLGVTAHRCYDDIAQLLLDYGANPDFENDAKESAISIASKQGCELVKQKLLVTKTKLRSPPK
jgi:ankyrin repeat protein